MGKKSGAPGSNATGSMPKVNESQAPSDETALPDNLLPEDVFECITCAKKSPLKAMTMMVHCQVRKILSDLLPCSLGDITGLGGGGGVHDVLITGRPRRSVGLIMMSWFVVGIREKISRIGSSS